MIYISSVMSMHKKQTYFINCFVWRGAKNLFSCKAKKKSEMILIARNCFAFLWVQGCTIVCKQTCASTKQSKYYFRDKLASSCAIPEVIALVALLSERSKISTTGLQAKDVLLLPASWCNPTTTPASLPLSHEETSRSRTGSHKNGLYRWVIGLLTFFWVCNLNHRLRTVVLWHRSDIFPLRAVLIRHPRAGVDPFVWTAFRHVAKELLCDHSVPAAARVLPKVYGTSRSEVEFFSDRKLVNEGLELLCDNADNFVVASWIKLLFSLNTCCTRTPPMNRKMFSKLSNFIQQAVDTVNGIAWFWLRANLCMHDCITHQLNRCTCMPTHQ